MNHALVMVDHLLVVFGGYYFNHHYDDTWFFNTTTRRDLLSCEGVRLQRFSFFAGLTLRSFRVGAFSPEARTVSRSTRYLL